MMQSNQTTPETNITSCKTTLRLAPRKANAATIQRQSLADRFNDLNETTVFDMYSNNISPSIAQTETSNVKAPLREQFANKKSSLRLKENSVPKRKVFFETSENNDQKENLRPDIANQEGSLLKSTEPVVKNARLRRDACLNRPSLRSQAAVISKGKDLFNLDTDFSVFEDPQPLESDVAQTLRATAPSERSGLGVVVNHQTKTVKIAQPATIEVFSIWEDEEPMDTSEPLDHHTEFVLTESMLMEEPMEVDDAPSPFMDNECNNYMMDCTFSY